MGNCASRPSDVAVPHPPQHREVVRSAVKDKAAKQHHQPHHPRENGQTNSHGEMAMAQNDVRHNNHNHVQQLSASSAASASASSSKNEGGGRPSQPPPLPQQQQQQQQQTEEHQMVCVPAAAAAASDSKSADNGTTRDETPLEQQNGTHPQIVELPAKTSNDDHSEKKTDVSNGNNNNNNGTSSSSGQLPPTPPTPPAVDNNSACSEEELLYRASDEIRFIKEYDTTYVDENGCYYLVSAQWIASWKKFVQKSGPLPGPIANGVFFDAQGNLRNGLQCSADYRGVNSSIWRFWLARYGGGPIVKRMRLEIYDPPIAAVPEDSMPPAHLSGYTDLAQVYARARRRERDGYSHSSGPSRRSSSERERDRDRDRDRERRHHRHHSHSHSHSHAHTPNGHVEYTERRRSSSRRHRGRDDSELPPHPPTSSDRLPSLPYHANSPYAVSAPALDRKRREHRSGSFSNGDSSRDRDRDTTSGLSRFPAGLANLGNTCFMNASLQCFAGIPSFAKGFRENVTTDSSELTRSLLDVLTELSLTPPRRSYFSCNGLLSQLRRTVSPLFFDFQQQDAHEFIRLFLDTLHEDMKEGDLSPCSLEDFERQLKKEGVNSQIEAAERWWSHFLESNNTLIAETFSGQLRSRVKCTMCGTTSDTFDPFFDLSLPLERAPRLSLHTCVESFFDEEILGQPGHQHYFCEVCKQKRRATKQLSITHVPKLLLVHLKRFSSTLTKVRTAVDIPMRLEKGEWMDKFFCGAEYDLLGVVQHTGVSQGGHYVAYAKRNSKWYLFDDDRVHLVSADEVQRAEAYCLFYMKVERDDNEQQR